MVQSVERRRESRDQALHRLAIDARERGITVLRHEPTNEYYVESSSAPGRLHRVTAVSCSCKGFQFRAYCCHLAALLDHLGWLPVSPDPTPAVATVRILCPDCRGHGWSYAPNRATGAIGRWACRACEGLCHVTRAVAAA